MAFVDFLPLIGGALQTGFNALVGQHQSKDLMRYQQQLNQQSIDIQNRYNSPIAQMERLREAGLNPNLVYGNGVDGNQSSSSQVGLANRNPQADLNFSDVVNNIFRRRQIENETNMTHANIENTLANKLLTQARYLDVMQDVARKDATFDIYVRKARADLDHTRQSIEESRQRVRESVQRESNLIGQAYLIQEQVNYWEAHAANERDYMPEVLRQRARQLETSADLNKEQKAVARSLARLNNKKVEALVSSILKMDLEAGNEAIEYEINKQMQNIGMTGVKPKDLLMLLKDLVIQALK